MQEAYPERLPPTERILRYADELAAMPPGDRPETEDGNPPDAFAGRIRQSHRARGRTIFLTAEGERWTDRQHLYLREGSKVEEIALPTGVAVTRPRLLPGRVIVERWNPWAMSATQKIRRYIASWADSSKRPEAALYAYDAAAREWRFVMPGHTLVPSPDGRNAALLRSGAMAAGYYSVHLWSDDAVEPPAILSLREAVAGSGRSFRLRWTADSSAVQIVGRTGGFARRKREMRDFNLIYLLDNGALYDLASRP